MKLSAGLISFHCMICCSMFAQKQNIKYNFFDFTMDSSRSRLAQLSVPSQGQSVVISNSLIADYVGNTRMSINNSIISNQMDSSMAINALFNGIGNFSADIETPLYYRIIRPLSSDFFGISVNPRANTLINTGQVFEKSTLNGDLGFNFIMKVSGDLGNIAAKLIFRNAISYGNQQFIERLYEVKARSFFYNNLQIRLRAFNNIFIINAPLYLKPLNAKRINGLPVYAGLGFVF